MIGSSCLITIVIVYNKIISILSSGKPPPASSWHHHCDDHHLSSNKLMHMAVFEVEDDVCLLNCSNVFLSYTLFTSLISCHNLICFAKLFFCLIHCQLGNHQQTYVKKMMIAYLHIGDLENDIAEATLGLQFDKFEFTVIIHSKSWRWICLLKNVVSYI